MGDFDLRPRGGGGDSLFFRYRVHDLETGQKPRAICFPRLQPVCDVTGTITLRTGYSTRSDIDSIGKHFRLPC